MNSCCFSVNTLAAATAAELMELRRVSHAVFTLSFIFNPSMEPQKPRPPGKVGEREEERGKGEGKEGEREESNPDTLTSSIPAGFVCVFI